MNQKENVEAEWERYRLFLLNRQRLNEMAYRAVTLHGRHPDKFAVIAINVDDSSWTELVDVLMPDATPQGWQSYRDRGELPVARGSVTWETVEFVCKVVPGISDILTEQAPGGKVYALICSGGGCSVYTVPFLLQEAAEEPS